jgi:alpha-methylacyl-CoA racemase
VRGQRREIAISHAAAWLALPRRWGLTEEEGPVGGAHAGYRVYRCRDGRVAVAALEPHFARRLCAAAGLPPGSDHAMFEAQTRAALTGFFAEHTREQLTALAVRDDLPLHTLA